LGAIIFQNVLLQEANVSTKRQQTIFFIDVKNQEEDIQTLRSPLTVWIRSLHNPDWPVYGLANIKPNTVIFFIESNAPLPLEVSDHIRQSVADTGFKVDALLLIPPAP
jgi:hypothetical protein